MLLNSSCSLDFAVSAKAFFSFTIATWSAKAIFATCSAVDNPFEIFSVACNFSRKSEASCSLFAASLALFSCHFDDLRSYSFNASISVWDEVNLDSKARTVEVSASIFGRSADLSYPSCLSTANYFSEAAVFCFQASGAAAKSGSFVFAEASNRW